MTTERLYTTQEAASLLGIGYHAMDKRFRRAGLVPLRRVSRIAQWSLGQIDSVASKRERASA